MRVEGRVVWTSGSWLSLDKDSIGERKRERQRERFFFGAKLMWQKIFFFWGKKEICVKENVKYYTSEATQWPKIKSIQRLKDM